MSLATDSAHCPGCWEVGGWDPPGPHLVVGLDLVEVLHAEVRWAGVPGGLFHDHPLGGQRTGCWRPTGSARGSGHLSSSPESAAPSLPRSPCLTPFPPGPLGPWASPCVAGTHQLLLPTLLHPQSSPAPCPCSCPVCRVTQATAGPSRSCFLEEATLLPRLRPQLQAGMERPCCLQGKSPRTQGHGGGSGRAQEMLHTQHDPEP